MKFKMKEKAISELKRIVNSNPKDFNIYNEIEHLADKYGVRMYPLLNAYDKGFK